MFKIKTLTILILSSILLIGCSNNTNTTSPETDEMISNKETFLSNPNIQTTPINFNTKTISSTKYLSIGSLVFFQNKYDNNKLSVIDDNQKVQIDQNNIIDIFDYHIESLTSINNEIYFSNSGDNNTLYKLDYLKKSFSKVSDMSFYNISSDNNFLFFLNKTQNYNLSLYDTKNNTFKSITSDKCGKYVVNGEFILYENLNDNSALYIVKIDGTERKKLISSPVDSFVPYGTNNVIYIDAKDNNLYNYNTLLQQSTRIQILNGTDLKSFDNKLFYINLSNSNHLYSLEIDEALTKVWTKELTTDWVNEYYPISNNIFFTKPININDSYILSYK